MKFSIVALILVVMLPFPVSAADGLIQIGSIPVVADASPALVKTLHALRQHIDADARDCIEAAEGMDATGNYKASIKKDVETPQLVSLEISGVMICDGVHSSSYRYGIAIDKKTGGRIDLSRIYDIVDRKDAHLFLRSDLVESVGSSYKQENANNASCLNNPDWKEGLANFPLTFLPESDGSLVLYYAVPDVSSACFPPLHLSRHDVAPFRNAVQADRYRLP
ncbi:hypothetical protein [Trinickia acidisoli]|uniref:hypothetical protein n=1 Tax=Trinickia acidisoli TaxID=2767482 RepID=UPI001A8DE005|nr:hypothetical protein [Trinickia acidisoli]